MFVQVMEGRAADPGGLERQMDRWLAELRPGAAGWLGSTAGVTADGHAIVIARFGSRAEATANSERPEQGAWWAETEQVFDGPVSFHDSDDVEVLLGGGSDEAGFVQVMQGRATDREALRSLEAGFEGRLAQLHPGLIGSLRCWYDGDHFTEAIYFSSEAEARRGEQALGEDPEAAAVMARMQELGPEPRFFDLADPMLAGP